MKKFIVNCYIVLFAALLAFAVCGTNISHAVEIHVSENDDGHLCGDLSHLGKPSVSWELTVEGGRGVLELYGAGALPDSYNIVSEITQAYEDYSASAQAQNPNVDIKEVYLDGISTIGTRNFAEAKLDIFDATGVKKIKDEAFFYADIPIFSISGENVSVGNKAFYSCRSGDSFLNFYSLSSVGNQAFYNCTSITNVQFSDSAYAIGEEAFFGTGLQSATGISISVIGDRAFKNCPKLASFAFTNLHSVGDEAFNTGREEYDHVMLGGDYIFGPGFFNSQTDPDIKNLTIAGGIVDTQAFQSYNIDNLAITSNAHIRDSAFESAVIKQLIVEEDATIEAFSFDKAVISSMNLSAYTNNIESKAFGIRDNHNLTGTIDLVKVVRPSSVSNYTYDYTVSMPADAFLNRHIKELEIKEGVISDNSFMNTNIGKLKLGSDVSAIGKYAFANNHLIEELFLPWSVYGEGAFSGCNNLKRVTLESSCPPEAALDAFDGVDPEMEIYVTAEEPDVSAYSVRPWSDFNVNLPHAPLVATTSFSETEECYYSISMDGTLTITGSGTMKRFTSADEQPWHKYRDRIVKVVIKNGISLIGNHAFESLPNLETVSLGATVKKIEEYAFAGDVSLKKLYVPEDITIIGEMAFAGCGLEVIELPSTLNVIDDGAFSDCKQMTTMYCHALTAPVVGPDIFNGCTALKDLYIDRNANMSTYNETPWTQFGNIHPKFAGIVIDSGVCGDNVKWERYHNGYLVISGSGPMYDYTDHIATDSMATDYYNYPWYNFRGSVKHVIIEEGVTYIGSMAFYRCFGLGDVYIASSVEEIGSRAFGNDERLEKVEFAENSSLKTIGGNAFMSCNILHYFKFPEGLRTISAGAFYNCNFGSDTTVTENSFWFDIPASVTTIEPGAFEHINQFTGVNVDENNPNYTSQDGVLYNKDKTTLIAYPTTLSGSHFIMPDTVKHIEDYAFVYCPGITIILSENLETIGWAAFHSNRAHTITTIEDFNNYPEPLLLDGTAIIPDTVTSIGGYAFSNSKNINNIEIRAKTAPKLDPEFQWVDQSQPIKVPADGTGYDEAPWWDYSLLFGDEKTVQVSHVYFDVNKYTYTFRNSNTNSETFPLDLYIRPTSAENDSVTWTSSNEEVLTVAPDDYTAGSDTATCTVTALKPGKAVIKAETTNGKSAEIKITVNPYDPTIYCLQYGHFYYIQDCKMKTPEYSDTEWEFSFTCNNCGETETVTLVKNETESDEFVQTAKTAAIDAEKAYYDAKPLIQEAKTAVDDAWAALDAGSDDAIEKAQLSVEKSESAVEALPAAIDTISASIDTISDIDYYGDYLIENLIDLLWAYTNNLKYAAEDDLQSANEELDSARTVLRMAIQASGEDNPGDPDCDHDLIPEIVDEEHHRLICTKCSYAATEEHSYSDYINYNYDKHYAYCTVCGNRIYEDHDYQFVGPEINHYRCSVCGREEYLDLPDPISGQCGDNLTYTLHPETGVLTISGTGEMYDYESGQSPFYGDTTITSIVISEGVTGIGTNAFEGTGSVTTISLPATLEEIREGAFSGCSSLNTVNYAGTEDSFAQITMADDVLAVMDAAEKNMEQTPETAESISDAVITLSEDHFTYDGEPKIPEVTVVLNGKILVEGEDYSLNYVGYDGVGEAYVEVYGINHYDGNLWAYYNIDPKKITPSVKLAATSYTWDGKAKKPGVTVKDGSTTLEKDIDYTVTYASGRKNVGSYKVTVKLINNYEGSKSVSFKINPKGTSLSKLTPAKKAITVKWAKQSKKMSSSVITGYQIQLATDSKFKKNVKNVNVSGYSKVSKKVTGLKAKTKYYVRIRTYKTVSGTKYYSPWSKSKNTKTK